MHHGCTPVNTLPLSHTVHTSSASHQPSLSPSHLIARSYTLPLPCGEYARALPFYLFLLCSINLSVQPDVGRASCIPNTKNNHFSVTGVEGGGGVGCLKGVCEHGDGVGWGVLRAHRHKTELQLQHRGRNDGE